MLPWRRRGALALWLGAVLMDVDHYLWFCLRERRVSALAAVRYFNEAHPPQHESTRTLHSPYAVSAMLVLGALRRPMMPVAVGMALHAALDIHHDARMERARAVALRRDGFACQACGLHGADLETHLRRQPRLLPSYSSRHHVALCGPCHEAAHAHGG
jgi:hypothetical protein